jgi:hypothetical protein
MERVEASLRPLSLFQGEEMNLPGAGAVDPTR